MVLVTEGFKLKSTWQITRFRDRDGKIAKALRKGLSLSRAKQLFAAAFIGEDAFKGNLALNEGINNVLELIAGISAPTAWNAANAYLGVGDSSTAAVATQTGLQAATNKTYKAMDGGYPARSNQTLEWRATFGSADANFAWEEYTVVNASTDVGANLNRKTSAKGTKTSGETWILSLTITAS